MQAVFTSFLCQYFMIFSLDTLLMTLNETNNVITYEYEQFYD